MTEEQRISESIFEDEPQGVLDEREGGATCSCRTWWKIAVLLVLIIAVVGIIAAKGGSNTPTTTESTTSAVRIQDDFGAPPEVAPQAVLATVNGESITHADLQQALQQLPPEFQSAFRNNQHELLEQLILRKLLLQEMGEADGENAADGIPGSEDDLIQAFLQREVLSHVEVSDSELEAFYEKHRHELPAGRSFSELKGPLHQYALQEKQAEAVEDYLARIGEQATITRDEDWIQAQKTKAADNPVDRALTTGRPVMVDFGRGSCVPCKMMEPILRELKDEYAGRAEIVYIQIDDYPALTQRHGIRAIPTQIFYDSEGQEYYRHQGFMGRADIIAKLAELGAM